MAFQKAYRLPRTYVFDGDDWRKLDTAKVIAPRSKTPTTHIEVDKTRQILMVVKNGSVYGTDRDLIRRHRQHARGLAQYPLEGARHDEFAGLRCALPHDDLPRQLRDPRLRPGAALSGQPWLRARAQLGRQLDVRQLVRRRVGLHLPLRRSSGSRRATAEAPPGRRRRDRLGSVIGGIRSAGKLGADGASPSGNAPSSRARDRSDVRSQRCRCGRPAVVADRRSRTPFFSCGSSSRAFSMRPSPRARTNARPRPAEAVDLRSQCSTSA